MTYLSNGENSNSVNRDQLRISGSGMITENFPIGAATAAGLMVSQTVYYSLIGLDKGDVITNINVECSSQGTTSTSVFSALYDSLGNRLTVSVDLTTILDSTGMKSLALTAPYTVSTTGTYYLAIMTISSNPATLLRGSSTSGAMVGIGSGLRNWSNQTGQSTMPITATFGAGSFAYWISAS